MWLGGRAIRLEFLRVPYFNLSHLCIRIDWYQKNVLRFLFQQYVDLDICEAKGKIGEKSLLFEVFYKKNWAYNVIFAICLLRALKYEE